MYVNSLSPLFQDDYMEALGRLHLTVSRAYRVNPEINFEVFIHKVDGLSDDHKIETQRDIHQRANDDLADASLEKLHLRYFLSNVLLFYCMYLYVQEKKSTPLSMYWNMQSFWHTSTQRSHLLSTRLVLVSLLFLITASPPKSCVFSTSYIL